MDKGVVEESGDITEQPLGGDTATGIDCHRVYPDDGAGAGMD